MAKNRQNTDAASTAASVSPETPVQGIPSLNEVQNREASQEPTPAVKDLVKSPEEPSSNEKDSTEQTETEVKSNDQPEVNHDPQESGSNPDDDNDEEESIEEFLLNARKALSYLSDEHLDALAEEIASVKRGRSSNQSFKVVTRFRDIHNANVVYEAGTDVSHFEEERLEKLVELGLVEIK